MTVRTAELIAAVAIALIAAGLMWKSTEGLEIGWVRGSGPGSGAWPFWLSTMMLVASLVTIVRWFLRATPESRSEEPFMTPGSGVLVALSIGALLAVLVGTYVIGMYFSIMIFLVFYLRFVGGHSWRATVPLVVAIPVLIFVFFEWALKNPLPKGYSEPLFYPIYDLIY
jgi:hypothetical protein